MLHGFLAQLVHGHFALSAEILCLHLSDDVHAEGADETAERKPQRLVREADQELPDKVGCERLYGLGHLVLTEARVPKQGLHIDDLNRPIYSILIFKGTGS